MPSYIFFLYLPTEEPLIMSHDSQFTQPLIFLPEDVHTMALFCKFHRDWAKYLGALPVMSQNTPILPHNPQYLYIYIYARWINTNVCAI